MRRRWIRKDHLGNHWIEKRCVDGMWGSVTLPEQGNGPGGRFFAQQSHARKQIAHLTFQEGFRREVIGTSRGPKVTRTNRCCTGVANLDCCRGDRASNAWTGDTSSTESAFGIRLYRKYKRRRVRGRGPFRMRPFGLHADRHVIVRIEDIVAAEPLSSLPSARKSF